jgi:hypothetical protein
LHPPDGSVQRPWPLLGDGEDDAHVEQYADDEPRIVGLIMMAVGFLALASFIGVSGGHDDHHDHRYRD